MQLAFFTTRKVDAMEELTWVRRLNFYWSMFNIKFLVLWLNLRDVHATFHRTMALTLTTVIIP